ncbi:MAG: hypothetical protein GOP50_12145 [Candidatus Heimdallarchaeota archaeon]|nr:hypothetical protein [Candidatus Heimdallarchaeota archaeon]
MKTIWKYLIGVFAGLLVTTAIIVPVLLLEFGEVNPPSHDNLVEHDPITIWGNDDFLDYDFAGTGTQNDPYIIEFLNITSITSYAIYIFGTNAHFVILNCLLSSSHSEGTSIHLENVFKGTSTVFNNTIINTFRGVVLSNTDSCDVNQNSFEFCRFAISLSSSDDSGIFNNTFYNSNTNFLYHIVSSSSIRMNLTSNTFDGETGLIQLDYSTDAYLIRNQMNNASFYLTYCQRSLISNNTGIDFNILLLYSRDTNITFNEGAYFSSFQSPSSRLEYNQFDDYSIRDTSISAYDSYIVNSNLAGDGYFDMIVSANALNLTDSLLTVAQILLINCTDIWIYDVDSSFQYIQIDLIYCYNIEVVNVSTEIYLYAQECNNISARNNGLMHIYFTLSQNLSIINNSFSDTDIYCSQSDNLEVTGNDFINSEISFIETENSYVANNYFFDGHIDSFLNLNISILSNLFEVCEYGLTDSHSTEIYIENNIFTEVYDVGPRIFSSESFSFKNNSISGENCGLNFYGGVGSYGALALSNNTVNSKPLGFIVDQNNLTLTNMTYGQLIILNCNNIAIEDITITNTSVGIFIYKSNYVNVTNTIVDNCYNGFVLTQSEYCIISEISISDCSNIGLYVLGDSTQAHLSGSTYTRNVVGVYISSSDLCVIENNTLYNNGDGLRIYYSDYVITHNNTFIGNTNRGLQLSGMNQGCNVTYNLFQDNIGYAIEISTTSTSHFIHHNAFIGNNLEGTSQALDRAGESIWYDDLSSEGNFWDDWSGSGSYQIDWQTVSVVDPYPLVSNPLS